MKQSIITAIIFFGLFIFSGCGSSNSLKRTAESIPAVTESVSEVAESVSEVSKASGTDSTSTYSVVMKSDVDNHNTDEKTGSAEEYPVNAATEAVTETKVLFSTQIVLTEQTEDSLQKKENGSTETSSNEITHFNFQPLETTNENEYINQISLQPAESGLQQSSVSTESIILFDNPTVINTTYSYQKLPEEYKVIYNKILSAMKSQTEVVTFTNAIDISVLMDIYSLIYTDEVNMQYVANSFKYDKNPVLNMKISYKYSQDVVDIINSQTEESANSIIAKITPTMTEYEIVKLFHDSIIQKCSYDASVDFSNMAYGALVKGKAACQGYAHALSYLCNKVGIENTFVSGFVGEPHVWNLVKVDGDWYNIDITGDDFETDIPGYISYNYFNVTDSELKGRQYYSSIIELPSATATEDNFFVHNGYLVSSKEAATQVIYNQCINALNNNQKLIYLKCTDIATYNDVYDYLFVQNNIFAIQILAKENTGVEFDENSIKLTRNDEMLTFHIVLSN